MQLTNIVSLVNSNLAGELLTLNQMIPFLDQTIDEINDKLNTTFPAFSEFDPNTHPDYPDYNFFPDQYIRTVVCLGAAFYFYITDEEGVNAAPMYQQMYQAALFRMERDYLPKVDEIWKKPEPTGYLPDPFAYGIATSDYYDTHDFDETGSLYPLTKVYVEGPQGIPGPTGPQGEPGVSITRISEDETSFYIHLSDGTIKQLSKPEGIQGPKGDTGKSIEYTWDGTYLGIRQEGQANYTYVNLKGDKGDTGNTGKSLEFIWNGTQLGIRQEGDATYQYVNLKGDKGNTGSGLEFTWNGTQLGVRVEGESQYQYVDLKGSKGDTGNTGKSLEFIWNGTQLGIRQEGDATYQYVNLKGDKGEKGEPGPPGTNLNLKVSRQYDTYEDLPATADIGYMCLVGFDLHIFTENGWVNAGKLTEIDLDLYAHIDGGLFTDESGVEIGESGLEALQNHIIDANTHNNLIIDGTEV